MKFCKEQLLLYAVTDRAWIGRQTLLEQIELALKGGITILQLREKNLDEETFLKEAIEVKKLCESYHVPFIINDNVEVALKCGADGVHVGIEDAPVAKSEKEPEKILSSAPRQKRLSRPVLQKHPVRIILESAQYFRPLRRRMPYGLQKTVKKNYFFRCNPGGCNWRDYRRKSGGDMWRRPGGNRCGIGCFRCRRYRKSHSIFKRKIIKGGEGMKTVLTIAGSDSSGGAGIQADLKTITMNGVYAMSAITALTAQNTTGVRAIYDVTPKFLTQQIDAVFEDIRPDAVKIGMVSSAELIHTIAERLKFYKAEKIVVDPVMVATSGSRLLAKDATDALINELLPLATVLTPNIPEAEVLAQMEIHTTKDMENAAKKIGTLCQAAVLLKGGHSLNDANDLLYDHGRFLWFKGKRINNPNTHGTGCTLSSAIASNLAKGASLEEAVKNAKDYLSGALAAMLDLGAGSGPVNHAYLITKESYGGEK